LDKNLLNRVISIKNLKIGDKNWNLLLFFLCCVSWVFDKFGDVNDLQAFVCD
jgi:hypothetical protein